MTLLTLLPLPTCLRPHEANAARVQRYAITRDAQIEMAADETALADRVRRGLAVQARVRALAAPRHRALIR